MCMIDAESTDEGNPITIELSSEMKGNRVSSATSLNRKVE